MFPANTKFLCIVKGTDAFEEKNKFPKTLFLDKIIVLTRKELLLTISSTLLLDSRVQLAEK